MLLKIRKFSPENSKVSKLGLSWDTFIQKRNCINLIFTREGGRGVGGRGLYVMATKNDAKFEEEFHLDGLFLIKVYNASS